MKNLNSIHTSAGWQFLPGIHKIGDEYNFTIKAPMKAEVSLLLYPHGSSKPSIEIPLDEKTRTGSVRSLRIGGIELSEMDYNYLIDGKVVQDPMAHIIVGREHFGAPLSEDPQSIRCRYSAVVEYDWEEDSTPQFSFDEMLLYKLHVRGFTKAAGTAVHHKGTIKGIQEMIPYFQELGVNTLELMPVYEFMEVTPDTKNHGMITERRDNAKVNYWGYISGFYFAPKRAYCATDDPEKEMKDLVKALHRAGMKCILEFYFPGTVSPSGAVRALQFWKLNYHIDGFHIKGDGLPAEIVLKDGILSDTLLLIPGIRTDLLSGESRTVAEINGGFMETMRRLLKSDEGMVENAMWRTRRNASDHGIVNYIACQDGFTLRDMVTYNYRHNEANGQDNNDGTDFNYSWNCGIEGPTRKTAIKKIREKQLRNAILMLMTSQGAPMLYAGDEFGNSQNGNNNAWCQDNPTGWLDWKNARKYEKLTSFVKKAVQFRKTHPVLHLPGEPKGTDYLGLGFPDVSYHGERAWYVSKDNTSRMFGAMYYGAYARTAGKGPGKRVFVPEDFLYIIYNFHWEERTLALPALPEGIVWKKVADTYLDWDGCFAEQPEEYEKTVAAGPRSIVILEGRKTEKNRKPAGIGRSVKGKKTAAEKKTAEGNDHQKAADTETTDGQ